MWYTYIFVQLLILHTTYSRNYDPYISLTDYNATNVFLNETTLAPYSKISVNVRPSISDRNVSFFVIQVHSFFIETKITSALDRSYVNGTNIGLVQILNGANNYEFYIENNNELNNTVLIAVTPYEQAPIPGGCNMEFQTENAPYQHISYTDELILVQAQAASVGGLACESSLVQHDLYHFYLPKADYSIRSYFDAIRTMLTVDNVESYGTKVASVQSWLYKFYNNYKGVGAVYTIVASYKHLKSAYIPIVSYGCDISHCFDTNYITILQYIVGGIGLFVCFAGHNFLQTQILLFSSLVSGCIFYILLFHILEEYVLMASLAFGCVFGILLMTMCKIFQDTDAKNFASSLFSFFALGFLMASTVFYSGLNKWTIIHNETTYWGFFASIVLLTMIILKNCLQFGNFLACAIVGAFAFVSFLCRFTTPGLEYIFITTMRRATVLGSEIAVFDAPYQWFDTKLTIVWLCLVVLGVSCQWFLRKSHGASVIYNIYSLSNTVFRAENNEHTPLLRPIIIQSTPTST